MKRYILAMDQGTTSSRAILYDRDARPVSQAQVEFSQIYPRSGWVEHDPSAILDSQFKAARRCVEQADVSPEEIAAVGITNQRETTLLWDRHTGRPVHNAIVWQCRRSAPQCDRLIAAGHGEEITARTGLVIDAYFSATKIQWMLEELPGVRDQALTGRLAFGTVDTWLVWNLTLGRVHATDSTNASRTMLMDLDRRAWDPRLCELFGIPMSLLPEIRPSSGTFGKIAEGVPGMERFAGIPITGIAGDQHAALFGQACFAPGSAKNTYGTGCFLLMNTGEQRVRSRNGLLSTLAWETPSGACYALEGSVFNAGSAVQWLRDELRMVERAPACSALAATVEPADDLYFVSAFTGLGAPHWDMYARGLLIGLTRGTDRARIARAVLDGIAYQVADLIDAMEQDAGIRLADLRADGGASASEPLMQFQADLLDCRVDRPADIETTALGAAFFAGLAVGFWDGMDAIASLRQTGKVFAPAMEADRRTRLRAGWNRALGRAKAWET